MNNYAKELLQTELSRRKNRNPFYSLRAFARDLGVNRTTLSDVLGEKRQLSAKNLEKLSSSLSLTEIQKNKLLNCRPMSESESKYQELLEDTFRVISNWYYLAILNLAKLSDNQANPKWIATRLAISIDDANKALEKLNQLGFIEIKNKKMRRTVKPLSTPQDTPSVIIRNYHSEILLKAESALHIVPRELRDYSTVTMAINPKYLPEAKKILKRCKRRLSALLEKGKAKEVYAFSYQLFPLGQAGPAKESQG